MKIKFKSINVWILYLTTSTYIRFCETDYKHDTRFLLRNCEGEIKPHGINFYDNNIRRGVVGLKLSYGNVNNTVCRCDYIVNVHYAMSTRTCTGQILF